MNHSRRKNNLLVLEWLNSIQEKVKVYSADELISIHESSGFKVNEVFGNYKLDYYEERSPRIILISEKK